MKKYNIIKLDSCLEYNDLIVMCNANSPFDYINEIEEEIFKLSTERVILIDQILHVGNTDKRFIKFSYEFDDTNKVNRKCEFVKIPKRSELREISCNYLKENKLVEYSILTSIQKRMIDKGIAI